LVYKSGNTSYNIYYTHISGKLPHSGDRHMNKVWTAEERNFIKENASLMTDKILAIKLCQITGRHVTLQSVRKQRQNMGISKQPGRGICAIVEPKEESCQDSTDV